MKYAIWILAICFLVNAIVIYSKDYKAGIREGKLRARTEAVEILNKIEPSGIICQKYIQQILLKYGVRTKLKIRGK